MRERFGGPEAEPRVEQAPDADVLDQEIRSESASLEAGAKSLSEDLRRVGPEGMESMDPDTKKNLVSQARVVIAAGAALLASPMILEAVEPGMLKRFSDAAMSAITPDLPAQTLHEFALAAVAVLAVSIGTGLYRDKTAVKDPLKHLR